MCSKDDLLFGDTDSFGRSRVYTDVAAGTAEVEKLIIGGPTAKKVVRWGRLETF